MPNAATREPDPRSAFSDAWMPSSVSVIVDPITLDRLFTISFEDRPTIKLRVPAAHLSLILSQLSRAVADSLN